MAELKRAQDQPRAEDFVGDMGNSRDRLTPEEPMVCNDSQTAGPDRPRLAQNETSQRQIQGQILDGEYVRASGVAPSPLTTPDNRVRDAAGSATSLLSESEIGDLRSRWNNIQAEFVDEPILGRFERPRANGSDRLAGRPRADRRRRSSC